MNWFKQYRQAGPSTNNRMNPFILDFRADFVPKQSMDAAIDAIHEITKKHSPPYTVFLSGGIDSQAMVLAWKKSGVPFRVVHYTYGTNVADNNSTLAFCMKHKIQVDLRSFDAKTFIESDELKQMAIEYDCSSPQILTYIKMIEQHSETCILAGNFIDGTTAGLNWTILALERFAQTKKQNLVPFFFLSTPALAYSMLDTYVQQVKRLNDLEGRMVPSYTPRVYAYQAMGYDVIPQHKKLSGFEELKDLYDNVQIDPKTKFKWYHMPSKRPFDLLFRYSLYDVIGQYSEKTVCVFNGDK